jgi:hypothetical protein
MLRSGVGINQMGEIGVAKVAKVCRSDASLTHTTCTANRQRQIRHPVKVRAGE